MKAVFVFFVVVAAFALSSATYDNGNGMPICTAANVATGKFRNNWDPTRYWVCLVLNATAESVSCPQETGFLDSVKECVAWSVWRWTAPVDPPTA